MNLATLMHKAGETAPELVEALVAESRGHGATRGRVPHPAPVVRQWTERLDADGAGASLLVLDYTADKARIVSRTAESFPLSARLADRS